MHCIAIREWMMCNEYQVSPNIWITHRTVQKKYGWRPQGKTKYRIYCIHIDSLKCFLTFLEIGLI